MQPWGPDREVEKPKPIKARASSAATQLLNLREALDVVMGCGGGYPALTEAIVVLQIVAGEKKASDTA